MRSAYTGLFPAAAMKPILLVYAGLSLLGTARADLLHDILTALEQAVECASCNTLLVPIQALAHLGNDAFVDTFTSICKLTGVRLVTLLQFATYTHLPCA